MILANLITVCGLLLLSVSYNYYFLVVSYALLGYNCAVMAYICLFLNEIGDDEFRSQSVKWSYVFCGIGEIVAVGIAYLVYNKFNN